MRFFNANSADPRHHAAAHGPTENSKETREDRSNQMTTEPLVSQTPPTNAPSSTERAEDRLSRIFNTAMISTIRNNEPLEDEALNQLLATPEFRAILSAVHQVAFEKNTTEKNAAEELIRVFRRIDHAWQDYVLAKGIESLRSR